MRSVELLFGVLLSSWSLAVLACEYPSLPDIPADERIRGRAERTIKDDVLRYITEMSVYVGCARAEHAAASRNDAPALYLSLLATRNDTAIAELDAVRDVYEESVGPLADLMFEPSDPGPAGGVQRRSKTLGTMRPDSSTTSAVMQECPHVIVTPGGVRTVCRDWEQDPPNDPDD